MMHMIYEININKEKKHSNVNNHILHKLDI